MKLPPWIKQLLFVRSKKTPRITKSPKPSLFDPSRRRDLLRWTLVILCIWIGLGIVSSVAYKKIGPRPTPSDIENFVRNTLHISADRQRLVE